MIDDLVIMLLAAGGPDLRTLKDQGNAVFERYLFSLQGQVLGGRQLVRERVRDGQILWRIEIIDPDVHEHFLLGLTYTACEDLDAEQGDFTEPEVDARAWQIFDAAEDRAAFYNEMVAFGAEVRARSPEHQH
jgi:hypothetical protein